MRPSSRRSAALWRTWAKASGPRATIERDEGWTDLALNIDSHGRRLFFEVVHGAVRLNFAEVVFGNGEAQVVDFAENQRGAVVADVRSQGLAREPGPQDDLPLEQGVIDIRGVTRTVAVFEELKKQSCRLVTASYTLVEAGALVRSRLGVDAFRALGQVVDRAVEVVWVDEDLHRSAWQRAASVGRRGPGLVDWVGFLVIAELGLDLAVAVDEHFREQGITTLPQ